MQCGVHGVEVKLKGNRSFIKARIGLCPVGGDSNIRGRPSFPRISERQDIRRPAFSGEPAV